MRAVAVLFSFLGICGGWYLVIAGGQWAPFGLVCALVNAWNLGMAVSA